MDKTTVELLRENLTSARGRINSSEITEKILTMLTRSGENNTDLQFILLKFEKLNMFYEITSRMDKLSEEMEDTQKSVKNLHTLKVD